MLVAE